MKYPKSLLCLGASLVALALAPLSIAQPAAEKPADQAEKGPREKGRRGGDRVAMLKERLQLTDEQVAKLQPIFAEQRAQMEKLRDLPREEAMAKRREIEEAATPKIKAVLTAEQAAKYDAMREEMRSRGGNRGEGRPKGKDKAAPEEKPAE